MTGLDGAHACLQDLISTYAVADFLLVGDRDLVRSIPDAVRSYVADGRAVAWNPVVPQGVSAAIDAEIALQPVSPALARRLRCDDPDEVWPRWTRCEVAAKLLNLPVLSWLNWPNLEVPAAFVRRVVMAQVVVGDVLVCCGLTWDDGALPCNDRAPGQGEGEPAMQ
ncbi:hypothetical protein [Rudaeicoccus suwonensis]|uniref:hypothetical protein n=1 Tax=Rudaeicoccus suwonensis TaxID=657409 RepID=UPI0011A0C45C|nr:hypothetical protein [Rudaeicoccus suwonensis]